MTWSPSNQAEQYISDVLNGSLTTSKLVRLACERHRRDLQDGHLRNLKFSPKHGQHVIDFIQRFCCHSQGEWAGQPFNLAPWQQALLWILYGWRWADTDYRRFKFAYIELAKGNGKSMLASALGVYELIASNEPGAEVYSVATKKDQARIVFAEAERMVAASPDLKKRIKSYRDCLFIPGNTGAKFQPLSSDEDSLDGPRPQAIIADEIHAWSFKARKLWDVLANALGKRRSPVFIAITTAGSGEESLCRQQNRYSEKVLSDIHTDDSWFAWICGLDDEDDFEDPANWVKANPNLGVSVNVKELGEAINKAKGDPASLNGVLRLRLGIWTQAAEAFIPMEEWELCNAVIDLESLDKQPCFGGLDLSTTTDISAFVLLFPPYGDPYPVGCLAGVFLTEGQHRKTYQERQGPV
jgi:phage terminase large subunit-like protein